MSLSPLKRGLFGLALGLALGAATAGSALAASIKLGVMGGSEEEIAEVAKQVAAKKGLEVELITFSDYAIPNEALEHGVDGTLDEAGQSRAGRLELVSWRRVRAYRGAL